MMNAMPDGNVDEQLLHQIETAPWHGSWVRGIDGSSRPVSQVLATGSGRVMLHLAPDVHHDVANMVALLHNHRHELVRLARVGLTFERQAARFGVDCLVCGSWDNAALYLGRRGDMAARRISCHECGAEYTEIWNQADEYTAATDVDGA